MTNSVDFAGLADLVGRPHASEDLARSLVVVDLDPMPPDAPATEVAETLAALRACPAVFAGRGSRPPRGAVAELADGLDTLVGPAGADLAGHVCLDDPDEALAELAAAVGAAPLAAVTMAQLLRLRVWADTASGLVAESLAYATLQASPEFGAWLADRRAGGRGPIPDPAPRVSVRHAASTVYVTLARPASHNAYDAAMRDQLVEVLRAAAVDPGVDGVVLSGEGPSFCAGGDLDEFGTAPDPARAHEVRMMRSAAWWADRLGGRLRVELHGACIGAGIELPAFAGTVVAAPDVRIRLPEVAMGLVPGAGGTVSITRRIGPHRTCWLAITGRDIGAETARRWGLVDRVEPAAGAGRATSPPYGATSASSKGTV